MELAIKWGTLQMEFIPGGIILGREDVGAALLQHHHLEAVKVRQLLAHRQLLGLLDRGRGLPRGIDAGLLPRLDDVLLAAGAGHLGQENGGELHAAEGEDLALDAAAGTVDQSLPRQ